MANTVISAFNEFMVNTVNLDKDRTKEAVALPIFRQI